MSFKHILVASDFSESAEHALDIGVDLAQKFDAELTLLHVWDIPPAAYRAFYLPAEIATSVHEAAQGELARAGSALTVRLPRARTLLRQGIPWHEVLSGAEQVHADLIVIGTHGRRGLSRALLGSVAERVVRLSAVPVLTVHGSPTAKS